MMPPTTDPQPAPTRAVTFRAVFIGFALMPVSVYWVAQREIVRYAAHPTTTSIFFPVVFILVLVTLLNRLVARQKPDRALAQGELLVIYTMVALASALSRHDMAQVLVPMISWPSRYATPANRWKELFFQYLPSWLMVSNPEVIKGYYKGNSSIYSWMHLRA